MDNYIYLLFNIGATCSALLVARRYSIKLNFKALMITYLLVSVPFIVWDAWAVSNGHWAFNQDYILDYFILNLALEEVLFFISVPLVMLIIFIAIESNVKSKIIKDYNTRLLVSIAILIPSILFLIGQDYTSIISVLFILFTVFLYINHNFRMPTFWIFQIVLLMLFFISNTVLTALPIIEYGQQAITGFRVGTIPIEDFLYNFVLINSFVLVYKKFQKLS